MARNNNQQLDANLLEGEVKEGGLLDDERIIYVAEFDPNVISYNVVIVVIIFAMTFFMIPFLLFLPCMIYGFRKSLEARRLIITEKTIVYRTAYYSLCCMCWNQTSKHVPLEKVTDVTWKQGCLQRSYGLATVAIQTAGSTGPDNRPELNIIGIVQSHSFRQRVMQAKGQHMARIYGGASEVAVPIGTKKGYGATESGGATGAGGVPASGEATQALLTMRDTLNRIENRVTNIEGTLTNRVVPPTGAV